MANPTQARGRGALSNASGRYEAHQTEAFDDGWGVEDPEPEQVRTTVTCEAPRKIITRNDSPDIGFDRSINAYRGCEHGCIYCFARPTHAYMGLSPGLDFETKLFAKPDAAKLLRAELMAKTYKPKPIAMGTNTDPYQPTERKMQITRSILEVLRETHHPCTIVTKSNLILRDIDILADMAREHLVKVALSITTLDRKLARMMEPRAATPERRVEAVRALSDAGVPVSVMVAPIIPSLTDHEMESILERAAEAGAYGAGYVLLRLPLEIKTLFREWLEANVPNRASRVISLIQGARGGKDYDMTWGKRMTGEGPYAMLIAERFKLAKQKLNLNRPSEPLALDLFKPPRPEEPQLKLL
ncbi:MAG: PA0069 family radical SAM protein [Alphaproteobacteria bacterium]